MPTHFRFEHDFDIDPKDYWDIFFSDEYTAELCKRTRLKNRHVLEMKDDGKILRRVQRLTPESEVPSFLRSIVSDITYTETDTLWRDRSEMEVVIEPAMMRNKFTFRATYGVKPLGPGHCRRTFEGDAKVSIMLVGGQVEKFMVDEMRKSYEAAAVVTREFIARRKSAV